jgi:hypothetical protein
MQILRLFSDCLLVSLILRFLWRVESDGSIHVWKWTGRNDYVALCELDSISFGGG